MGVRIVNAEIVTAEAAWRGEILCRKGRIAELGPKVEIHARDEVLDAEGLLVLPGAVDPHVHLELEVMGTRSSDDFETGTAAGLAGGTTTVIDFIHPERRQAYDEALRARRAEAEKAVADYGLHMAVTWWDEGVSAQLARLVRKEGVPSFKSYLAYKGTIGIEEEELSAALGALAPLGATMLVHCEDGDAVERLAAALIAQGRTGPRWHPHSRPIELEATATETALRLARRAHCRVYIVHVTGAPSAAAVHQARNAGQAAFGETCTHYLLLDASVYESDDFEAAAYVLSPPLRAKEHQGALWQALQDGTLDLVSTDHCPFHLHGQKDAGRDDFRRIPGGGAGIQDRLSLLWTHGVEAGRIDRHRFVDLVSTAPARLFGLHPRKGSIRVGADADLVLFDPEATRTIAASEHLHRCDRSLYEGFPVKGVPRHVLSRGEVVVRDGAVEAKRGRGRFLERRAAG